MNGNTREDYVALLAHWNRAFAMTEEDTAQYDKPAAVEEWKALAPTPRLLAAAEWMKDCENVLDYGGGDGWAGIVMAKYGCRKVICADPAANGVAAAAMRSKRFCVEERMIPVCIDESWLSTLPEAAFDGFFCSNVIDVVPPEMAEDILRNAARVTRPGGKAIIGMNYYIDPKAEKAPRFERRSGNCYYIDGVLRLVSRTDEEWTHAFEMFFRVEKLEHFAWPGETVARRRLFYLTRREENL